MFVSKAGKVQLIDDGTLPYWQGLGWVETSEADAIAAPTQTNPGGVLTPAAPAGGTSLTFTDLGAWVTSTVYAVSDITTQSGVRYLCRTAHTSGTFATDLAAGKWVSLDGGAAGAEDVTTVATSGSSQTLTLPSGGIGTFDVTLTAATVTLAFAGATSGKADTLTLIARQDGTGSRAITWPASVTWVGGVAPVLSTTALAVDVITLLTVNGGTTWYGFAGSGSSSSARGRSTGWFTNAGSRSAVVLAAGTVLAMPLDVGSCTLTQLAVNVTVAAASSTVRLGIYTDSNGMPGTLLVDPTSATPLDSSTTGVKSTSTFSQAVTGRVWVVINVQGGGPTVSSVGNTWVDKLGYDTAANALGFSATSYTAAAVTSGALPSTYTVVNASANGALVAAKVG